MTPKVSAASHVIVLLGGIQGITTSTTGKIALKVLSGREASFVPVLFNGSFDPMRAIDTLQSVAKGHDRVTFIGDTLLGARLAHDTIAQMQYAPEPLPAFNLILIDASTHIVEKGRLRKSQQQRYITRHNGPNQRVLHNVGVVFVQSHGNTSDACSVWRKASRRVLSTIALEPTQFDDPGYWGQIISRGLSD